MSRHRSAGDARFRTALSASSKAATRLYPNLAGPTLLLNLPFLLQVCEIVRDHGLFT